MRQSLAVILVGCIEMAKSKLPGHFHMAHGHHQMGSHKSLFWQLFYAVGLVLCAVMFHIWPYHDAEDWFWYVFFVFWAVVFAVQLIREMRS